MLCQSVCKSCIGRYKRHTPRSSGNKPRWTRQDELYWWWNGTVACPNGHSSPASRVVNFGGKTFRRPMLYSVVSIDDGSPQWCPYPVEHLVNETESLRVYNEVGRPCSQCGRPVTQAQIRKHLAKLVEEGGCAFPYGPNCYRAAPVCVKCLGRADTLFLPDERLSERAKRKKATRRKERGTRRR